MRIHYKIDGKIVKVRSGAVTAPGAGHLVKINDAVKEVEQLIWDESEESDEFIQDVRVILV